MEKEIIQINESEYNSILRQFIAVIKGFWILKIWDTEPELLVGVIPSGNVEADEASQEGDDLVAGDFWEADKLV